MGHRCHHSLPRFKNALPPTMLTFHRLDDDYRLQNRQDRQTAAKELSSRSVDPNEPTCHTFSIHFCYTLPQHSLVEPCPQKLPAVQFVWTSGVGQ